MAPAEQRSTHRQTDALLQVKAIECRYQGCSVVRNLSISINDGEIFSLLGPSGCGKTTALRAIAGFEPVYHGSISIRGEIVSRPGYILAPERRRLGMVFQDYALFPHLNIYDNVCFGLRGLEKKQRDRIAEQMLELVGMQALKKRFPHELSGGQQQRVSLARALAPQPELILLDEPFSSLDVSLRERLSVDVRNILKQQQTTAIIVTHDQYEAFAMGDLVGVMKDGSITQLDTPYNLYHEPENRFVAEFIGQGRFLKGTLLGPDRIETEIGIISSDKNLLYPKGTKMDVLLRPDDLVPDPNGNLVAEVVQKAFKGAEILYTLRLPSGVTLLSLFPSHHNHEVGERVTVRIAAKHLVAFSTG